MFPSSCRYCKSKYHSYWMDALSLTIFVKWKMTRLSHPKLELCVCGWFWPLGGRMLPLGAPRHTGPHDWAVSSDSNLLLQYELHSNSLFTGTPLLERLPSLLNPSVPITLWVLQMNQSLLNKGLDMWHMSVILASVAWVTGIVSLRPIWAREQNSGFKKVLMGDSPVSGLHHLLCTLFEVLALRTSCTASLWRRLEYTWRVMGISRL